MNMIVSDRENDVEKSDKIQMQDKIDKANSMDAAVEEFENFFKNQEENEEKTSPRVEIVYNAINNTYSVDGVPYSKIIYNKKDQKETNTRLIEYLNEKYDINLLEGIKNKKKAIKNLDPTVLAILNSKKGKEACQKYIESVGNGIELSQNDKIDLGFDIKYDLNGMNKNDDLTLFNKIGIMHLANKNSKIAQIEKEVSKPKYEKGKKGNFLKRISRAVTAVVAGVTLAGVAGNTHSNQNTLDSGEMKQLSSGTGNNVVRNIEIEQKKVDAPNLFRDSLIVENVADNTNDMQYVLGDMVHLDEGCNYYEDSMENGAHNVINTNNQWRKAGSYMLDGLAVTYQDNDGNWKIAKSDDDFTNGGNYGNLGLNSNEYVQKIMQEKGLSKDQIRVMYHINMGTAVGEHPTGWIELPKDGFQVESSYKSEQTKQFQNDENIR